MSIRLILADGHPLVVDALVRLLCDDRFTVVATANDGQAALLQARRLLPDVLLLEFSLPLLDGLAVVKALRGSSPGVRCVFVTGHADLGQVRAAFTAGAFGYVAKDASPDELREAVARASRGETYVTPGLGLESSAVPPRSLTDEFSGGLTARQAEVLREVALGRTGKQIAERLGISLKTVESHRACIARQLGVRSPAGFTRHAVQYGLILPMDLRDPTAEAPSPGSLSTDDSRSSGVRPGRGRVRRG